MTPFIEAVYRLPVTLPVELTTGRRPGFVSPYHPLWMVPPFVAYAKPSETVISPSTVISAIKEMVPTVAYNGVKARVGCGRIFIPVGVSALVDGIRIVPPREQRAR